MKMMLDVTGALYERSTITSMEEIMRKYSLLRVRVIDKEITVDEHYLDLFTWYKLEIVEVLHQQNGVNNGPLPEDVPSRLLPLLSSETLLVMPGSVVTVDGVRVVRAIDGFALSKKQEYLIAAKLACGSKLIIPVADSAGVFRIENNNLSSLDRREHELVREVEQVYGNDLGRFRSDVRMRPRREN